MILKRDSRPAASAQDQFLTRKPIDWVTFGLFFCLLACSNLPTVFNPRTPTPTPVVIRFTVQEETMLADSQIATPTDKPVQPKPIAPDAPLPLPTETPPPPLPTPDLPETPDRPTLSPIQAADVAALPSPPPSDNVYSGPLTNTIELLDPAPGFTLPVGVDQLEFKWAWHGQEIRPCQLIDGYGFTLRIWANPASPHLPETVRQAIQPLGVADFVAVQDQIAASCDPETRTRRYLLNQLKRAPGVDFVGGSGHFFWDIAYAQLKPYYVELGVAPPRDFFILPAGPTPMLAVATPSPTPAYPLTPQPRPAGSIALLKPEDGPVYPVAVGPVQFEWRWEGQASGVCQLPPGYGFELRIWSKQPGFVPLGVLDAVKDQRQIQCDPANGVYSLIVPDLKTAPGVIATYTGEYRWDGQFWWDVALVSISPYRPPESASARRGFEISLHNHAGPADWFGRPIRCSQFTNWPEAQAVFLTLGGPGNDPNNLDPDGNQIACDELRQ